ncbi:hypothetical protein LINGRAHAP2_LOCUS17727 [Linum grandiflorum]
MATHEQTQIAEQLESLRTEVASLRADIAMLKEAQASRRPRRSRSPDGPTTATDQNAELIEVEAAVAPTLVSAVAAAFASDQAKLVVTTAAVTTIAVVGFGTYRLVDVFFKKVGEALFVEMFRALLTDLIERPVVITRHSE